MGLFDLFKKKTPEAPPVPIVPQKGFHSLTVADVVAETADAVSIYFEVPPALKELYTYRAGQYITLRLVLGGNTYLRCYSLSSCPDSDNYFRIGVKTKVGGKVSGYLVENCRKGMTIDVFTPLGSFTPPIQAAPHYALYGGGSGITPLLSIAKSVLFRHPQAQVSLLYANRNPQSIIYAQEWARLQAQYPARLRVDYILEQADGDTPHYLKGIATPADYAQWCQQYTKQSLHFVCGPEGMMQAVRQGLADIAHVPAENIYIESFDFSQQSPDHSHSTHTSAPATNNGGDADGLGANATITVQRKNYYIHIAPNTSILTACLDNNIDAPYMCEAGVCSSCRAKLLQGKADMQVCYALSDKEIAEGYILTCQAIPKSNDITISYDA
ncbi:MAG: ferredoxin--NADP reductase [Sphingobacteriales bacterium]|nr:ferredoxin--NADP reductase [Sphingobacteriales bacterium]MCC7223731.1 ferredoxin--NADP reductase [Chitinophagales bacterium]